MKLLHITNRYPPYGAGLSERQCRLVVNELTQRGHFNRVLTSNEIVAGVADREILALRHLRLGHARGITPFFRLWLNERRNRRALSDELDQVPPDVVIAWSMSGLSNTLLWEVERRGLRLVIAVMDQWPRHRVREDPWYQWWTAPLPLQQKVIRRGLYSLGLTRAFWRRFPLRQPTQLRLNHAFFASRALRESMRGVGYNVEGSDIIPHCIGRDEFPAQPQRRDDLRRLLWIGRLDADRDPMTAIRAIQELRHTGEMRFSLDIFGRGNVTFESRLHDYLRDSQLGGAVTIRHANADEMVLLFPTYDIFLFTARYPDVFPLVLLRAMASRIPIVTTLEGSTADIIRTGANAITFRTSDPVDCARRIYELADDRGLVERITDQAYRDVLDNFSALTVAGRVERLLNELVRQRG